MPNPTARVRKLSTLTPAHAESLVEDESEAELPDGGLTWSDVQVCTTVAEPSPGSVAARVQHGTWRWSRCELEIFLLTADGVHRISAALDLARAVRHDHDRTTTRKPDHDHRT